MAYQMTQLDRIEAMMESILDNRYQWVGGYSHGRTSNDDAFVVLYPSWPQAVWKVCRVYQEQFHQLPDFVDTNVSPHAPENPGKRPEQIRAGNYWVCPKFSVLLQEKQREGEIDTELRFRRVLRVTNSPPKAAPDWPDAVYAKLPDGVVIEKLQSAGSPEPAADPQFSETAVAEVAQEIGAQIVKKHSSGGPGSVEIGGYTYQIGGGVRIQGNARVVEGVLQHYGGGDYFSVEVDGRSYTMSVDRIVHDSPPANVDEIPFD